MLDIVGQTVKVRARVIAADARVVLLGPQRVDADARRRARASSASTGRSRPITAGWQEREADDDEPARAPRRAARSTSRLHARAEEVFASDPELAAAHRARQAAPAPPAGLLPHPPRARRSTPRARSRRATSSPSILERRGARVDRRGPPARRDPPRALHARSTPSSTRSWRPPSARRSRATARARAQIVDDCDALVIAGGHVASLLNRLRLFDVARARRRASRSSPGRPARWRSPSASCCSTTTRRTARASPRCSTPGSASRRDVVVLPQPALPAAPRRPRARRACSRGASRPATCVAMRRARATWLDASTDAHGASRDDGDAPARRRAATSSARRAGSRAHEAARSRSTRSSSRAAHARGGRRVPRGARVPDRRGPTRHVRLARRGRGGAPQALDLRPAVVAAARARRRTPTSGTSRSSSRRGSRVEYKLEVVRGGHGEWIEDPLNPNRARDPFGANSVAARRGLRGPRVDRSPIPRRAPGHARASSSFDSKTFGRRARRRSTCRRASGARAATRCSSSTTAATTCATRA